MKKFSASLILVIVLFVMLSGFSSLESKKADAAVTCPAPLDVALFKNGGGPPVAPGASLLANTSYVIKLSTQTPGAACITSYNGFTIYGVPGCEEMEGSGAYVYFKTITTNSSLPSGVSMTITSYCGGSPGGSAMFSYP